MKRIGLLCVALLFPFSAYAIEVKEVKTPGGLTAWLVERHDQPIITVKLTFKDAGTATDPQHKEGRVSFVTEMLFEGAGSRDALAFNEALESRAIRLDINADEDAFTVALQTLSEHKKEAFALLSDTLTRPRFEAAALERVRTKAFALLKSLEQSPNHALTKAWREVAFGKHAYGKAEEGTLASIKAMERKDLVTFMQRYLTRDNLIIAVAGDITEPELATLLDQTFARLPSSFSPEESMAHHAIPEGKAVHVNRDIPQTLVTFGVPGIARSDPDYMAAYVMNYIIGGGGLNSRLGKEIREKRGLTYGIGTDLVPMLHSALWQGQFATRTEKVEEALKVTRELISSFAAQGPTAEELDDAKRYLTGSFMLNLDSNGEVASYLISMQLYHLGTDYLNKRNTLIDAVTIKDVQRVAKRLLNNHALTVATVGKAGKPNGQR